MTYDSAQNWSAVHTARSSISYPAEAVIRIFKGSFPELRMEKPLDGQTLLDLGCGDGRHIPFFQSIGVQPFGLEITEDAVAQIKNNLSGCGVTAQIAVGDCGNIPFDNFFFDFVLAWNSCYYMSLRGTQFLEHVDEMARVLKPRGKIVVSIPKSTNFIFKNSVPHSMSGYRVITNDPFRVRDGEVMRCFASAEEIQEEFSQSFHKFDHADIEMDWFGLDYNWFVFVAERKEMGS
jgi:SAM-dependent methyltransferase